MRIARWPRKAVQHKETNCAGEGPLPLASAILLPEQKGERSGTPFPPACGIFFNDSDDIEVIFVLGNR
jgi:hypothetical protein